MDKRKTTAIVGVLSVMALGVLAGCGPKADDTSTTTTAPSTAASTGSMSASPGTMSASPGAMGTPGAPGTMATSAPPPGPK